MPAKCIVCGKEVAYTDQQEHLATNHLGPHYFWFDAKKFKSMEPSTTMAKIKALVGASALYPVCEEIGGKQVWRGDGEAVDLTHAPHFFAVPPATY